MKKDNDYHTIPKPEPPCFGCKGRTATCKSECPAFRQYDKERFAYYDKVNSAKKRCEAIYGNSQSKISAIDRYSKAHKHSSNKFHR